MKPYLILYGAKIVKGYKSMFLNIQNDIIKAKMAYVVTGLCSRFLTIFFVYLFKIKIEKS